MPNHNQSWQKEFNIQSETSETNFIQSEISISNTDQSPLINSLSNDQSESSFDKNAPKPKKKLPKLALVTSGGGFRAMIAYSGVYKVILKGRLARVIHFYNV